MPTVNTAPSMHNCYTPRRDTAFYVPRRIDASRPSVAEHYGGATHGGAVKTFSRLHPMPIPQQLIPYLLRERLKRALIPHQRPSSRPIPQLPYLLRERLKRALIPHQRPPRPPPPLEPLRPRFREQQWLQLVQLQCFFQSFWPKTVPTRRPGRGTIWTSNILKT